MANEPTVEEVRNELYQTIRFIERSLSIARRVVKNVQGSGGTEWTSPLESAAFEIAQCIENLVRLRSHTDELYTKAITDGLTKLLNRGYFEEIIKPDIERFPNAAIIIADIDHFKKYNDRYGHQQGDRCLRTIADVVRSVADTERVARYGGEEFSVILAGYANTKLDAKSAAERIRASVESAIIQPFSVEAIVHKAAPDEASQRKIRQFLSEGKDAHYYDALVKQWFPRDRKLQNYVRGLQRVTLCCGVAIRNNGESTEELIERADGALYSAKLRGRNRIEIA